MSTDFSRRDVLRSSGVLAVGMMTPPWLSAVAKADVVRAAKGEKADPDTTIVVIQLSGGNDGLNTVVPYNLAGYYDARKTLAIPKDKALDLGSGLGFHPAMTGLHGLYKEGKVAIIQGVGYPNPNRSHFKSMDIWQSASPDGKMSTGWIGRYMDDLGGHSKVDALAAIGLSTEKPRALNGTHASIPCFAGLGDVQQMVGDADMEKMLRQIQGTEAPAGSATRAIQQANASALDAMAALKAKLGAVTVKQTYNNDVFGNGFKQIAQLVCASPQTRVVYFSAGGFDTHAKQAEQHEKLLKSLSDGLAAFQAEITAAGRGEKVMVLVFSEFGRRTYENGSGGTDHGQAAPMFLVGNRVKGGLYGANPDFAALQDGDLRWQVDFRSVYATALDQWLGTDSKVVLGESFAHLPVLK